MCETGISVTANVPVGHVTNVAKAVVDVLRAGFKTHADQKTIRAALAVIQRGASVDGTTISHNYIS